jgi:SAM-dependent methyltransferase
MTAPSPWVVRFAPCIANGGRILDVAAGAGRHTRFFREHGHPVVAVDVDVSRMRDLAEDDEVELVEADLEHGVWPFGDRRFSGIVVVNYLHRPLLPVLVEALAPGGVLIYETFAVGNEKYGRPSNPAYLLREGELLEAFEPRLRVIAYEHVEEAEPRPAVRQRICAVLAEDATEAPEGHPHADRGAQAEQ